MEMRSNLVRYFYLTWVGVRILAYVYFFNSTVIAYKFFQKPTYICIPLWHYFLQKCLMYIESTCLQSDKCLCVATRQLQWLSNPWKSTPWYRKCAFSNSIFISNLGHKQRSISEGEKGLAICRLLYYVFNKPTPFSLLRLNCLYCNFLFEWYLPGGNVKFLQTGEGGGEGAQGGRRGFWASL